MSSVQINPDELSESIKEALNEMEKEVIENVNKFAAETAKETVSELKSTSPVRQDGFKRKYPPGSYAKSWKYDESGSQLGEKSYVVRNAKHYQLTHLLEHGHIIKKTGRRSTAFAHIEPAERNAIERFTDKVEGMKL